MLSGVDGWFAVLAANPSIWSLSPDKNAALLYRQLPHRFHPRSPPFKLRMNSGTLFRKHSTDYCFQMGKPESAFSLIARLWDVRPGGADSRDHGPRAGDTVD